MPINRAVHISAEIEEVKWLKPNSILDVGIGFGMMGVVFRAATDIRKSEINPESYHSWPTRIDGIEIFEWYRNPAWQVYTNVYIGSALEVIDTLGMYDMVYCGDVIEHLSKEDGTTLIEKMLAHSNQWVQIATPFPVPKQDPILGNENERHILGWSLEDFKSFSDERGYTCEMVADVVGENSNMLCIRIKK